MRKHKKNALQQIYVHGHTHKCAHIHTPTPSASLPPSKTSGQSIGTVGGYGVMKGRRKKGAPLYSSVPPTVSRTLAYTQTHRHMLH